MAQKKISSKQVKLAGRYRKISRKFLSPLIVMILALFYIIDFFWVGLLFAAAGVAFEGIYSYKIGAIKTGRIISSPARPFGKVYLLFYLLFAVVIAVLGILSFLYL